MNRVYLLLGSNLDDRAGMLDKARRALESVIGPIISSSSIYESEPWGFKASEKFLNQVVVIETLLSPSDLLSMILQIEESMGRKRFGNSYQSRTIDIDILFYNDRVISEPELKIPHPRIEERKFTLMPLSELNDGMIHPAFNKSIGQLLDECLDDADVDIYRPIIQ